MESNSKIVGVLFLHNGNHYYYDTNKNTILAINKELYKKIALLKDGKQLTKDEQVEQLINHGFLSKSTVDKIELLDYDSLKNYVNRAASHLILQTTKNCNLECRYCTYAGDGFYDRQHSIENMRFTVAKKALDLFWQHSQDTNNVTISFYGGEPLINFELIKQAINYSEILFDLKDITFTITTNGILLNKSKFDFLEKHNVYITVSLDGPREINDRFRKNRYGVGSFDTVINNLISMAEIKPDYYKNNISVNSVVTPFSDIPTIKDFFVNKMKISEDRVSMSNINTEGLDLIFDETLNLCNPEYKRFVDKEKNKEFEKYKMIYNDKSILPHIYHHFGPCIPISKKMFVSTEGKFYPCEKVSELNDICCIGDIDKGINYLSIYDVVNIGLIDEKSCKNCWAIRYCSMCIAEIAGNRKEDIIETKRNLCEAKKRNILDFFRSLIDLGHFPNMR